MTQSGNTIQWLPTTREELTQRGWDELDILLITGDAYIDHPSFGIPLLGRVLEAKGYRVGILAQPKWSDLSDITSLGRPKLFVGISAGSMDSLINKYTANKRLRDYDAYTPGGDANQRPERASLVYANLARKAFPGVPVILGGIEASLRRFTHYDYWENRLRRSLLFDSRADLLVHGMAEKTITIIADHLRAGNTMDHLPDLRGTARLRKDLKHLDPEQTLKLASYEEVLQDKKLFNKNAVTIERESNPHNAKILVEPCQGWFTVVQPPVMPLTTSELDEIYELPFTKRPHPKYVQPIPAYEVIKFSVQTNRGCFGGCSFCAITLQQGREIQSRSPESLRREVERLKTLPGWAGTVTDLGGPSANMYKLTGKDQKICEKCKKMSCLFPEPCFNLNTDQTPQIDMMRSVRQIKGVKHVFIASGIRYDLALRTPEYIKEMTQHHTGGVMSVAPEHTDPAVLKLMKKPPIEEYNKFVDYFNQFSLEAGKKQSLSPYFIASFPGSDLTKTGAMSEYFKKHKMRPEQIQDFIPSPMTLATAMYYTELDPSTNEPLYIEKQMSKRKLQKRVLQSFIPSNRMRMAKTQKQKGRFPRTYIMDETVTNDLDING
ncbi:MAG: YgiQ family radical SAM protein [Oligoflexia bacterium]|nr:YgiQ family radical SAM protein [Oligoflexia bacterium]